MTVGKWGTILNSKPGKGTSSFQSGMKELWKFHSVLIRSRKLNKLKNQLLLRFIREVRSWSKWLPPTWRELQATTENHDFQESWPISRSLRRNHCHKEVWTVIEKLLESHCEHICEFKTLGNPVIGGLPHLCVFYFWELDLVLTVNIREKSCASGRWRGKG